MIVDDSMFFILLIWDQTVIIKFYLEFVDLLELNQKRVTFRVQFEFWLFWIFWIYWFNSCLAGSEQKVNYWRQLADPCYPDHQRCALCNRPAYNHVVIRPVTAGAERFRLFAILNPFKIRKIRNNFKISGKTWKLWKKRMSWKRRPENRQKIFNNFVG